MTDGEIFEKNRVILCHFDSYSTALVFARFGNTLLSPAALPQSVTARSVPVDVADVYAGNTVVHAAVTRYGLNPAEVFRDSNYDAWLEAEGSDPIRVHLLRFKTFLAPAELIQPHGGAFFPISALRGAPTVELGLVRGVFNLIVGGDQNRG